jgi:hypothetical protein
VLRLEGETGHPYGKFQGGGGNKVFTTVHAAGLPGKPARHRVEAQTKTAK